MFEWEEAERFSFEDSDRFEEDSICSWMSEPESVLNNWRGWKGPKSSVVANSNSNLGAFGNNMGIYGFSSAAAYNAAQAEQQNAVLAAQVAAINKAVVAPTSANFGRKKSTDLSEQGRVLPLIELAAREVATSIPFELVEEYDLRVKIPDELQLRIAFWSFPEQEEDIRLYSCLANGSADEFIKGEHLLKIKAVKDPLQIGFHLSATVAHSVGGNCAGSGHLSGKQYQSTSVKFDRKNVVHCQCSCNSQAEWCSHVVALCLHRIHQPHTVRIHAPISNNLQRLQRDQLQKFAQHLIYQLQKNINMPQQVLPTAQKILDQLLSTSSEMNTQNGAPDPTLGGELLNQSSWCLDHKNLRDNIKKILIKFCVPAPIVFSDVNYLSTTAPPSASEWCSFLRPLRGREPEGMWNLLSIVREMFKRNDRNSVPLLEIITQQCLEIVQIMVWWFNTKVALTGRGNGPGGKAVNSNAQASQNACASLCDEIVTLWKLAAINPCIAPSERELLKQRLINYHITVLEKIQANQTSNTGQHAGNNGNTSSSSNSNGKGLGNGRNGKPTDLEVFTGFKPAIEGCLLDWESYPIPGVTYGHNSHYLAPFAVFKLDPNKSDEQSSQVNSSQAVLRCEYPRRPRSRGQVVGGSGVLEENQDRKSSYGSETTQKDNAPACIGTAREEESAAILACNVTNERSPLLRLCSKDSSSSIAAENCSREVNAAQDLNESGPGSFTSTSSSGAGSNTIGAPCDNEELSREKSNISPSLDGSVEPEPSKSHKMYQEAESGNESAPEQLSRENSATEFLHSLDGQQVKSKKILESNALENQYQVYFYDPKESASSHISATADHFAANQNISMVSRQPACKNGDVTGYIIIGGNKVDVFKNLRINKLTDEKDKSEVAWEVKFMRAEGIHAHGYHTHAFQMAVDLAQEMLKNPPNLGADLMNGSLPGSTIAPKG